MLSLLFLNKAPGALLADSTGHARWTCTEVPVLTCTARATATTHGSSWEQNRHSESVLLRWLIKYLTDQKQTTEGQVRWKRVKGRMRSQRRTRKRRGSRKAGCNGLETNVKGSRNPYTKGKERWGKSGWSVRKCRQTGVRESPEESANSGQVGHPTVRVTLPTPHLVIGHLPWSCALHTQMHPLLLGGSDRRSFFSKMDTW